MLSVSHEVQQPCQKADKTKGLENIKPDRVPCRWSTKHGPGTKLRCFIYVIDKIHTVRGLKRVESMSIVPWDLTLPEGKPAAALLQ